MTVWATSFHSHYEQLTKVDAFVLYVHGRDFVVDAKYHATTSHFSKDICHRLSLVSSFFRFSVSLEMLHLIVLCVGNSSTPKLSTRDTFPGINRQNSDISFGEAPNTSAIHIAIDWDPTALHLRYQSTRERVCGECKLFYRILLRLFFIRSALSMKVWQYVVDNRLSPSI